MTWEKTGRRATAAFLVFLLFVGTCVILPSLLENNLATGTSDSEKWVFWFQTASGNWTGTRKIVGDWWFAFSAVAAILLNNSLLFVIVALIWRWNVERKTAMKLNQAFVTRDQMNKQALYDELSDDPEMMQRIDIAFRNGEQAWKKHLVATFGPEDAEKVFSMLGQTI